MRRGVFFWLFVSVLLAVGACADSSASDNPTQQRRRLKADEPAGDEDPTDDLLPEQQAQKVDWEAATAYRQLPPADAPDNLRETFAESPVPVLVPDDPQMLRATSPMTGKHWYAASIHLDGVGINIQGSRVARVMPDLEVSEPGQKLVDDKFLITRTDGIVSLSFTDFGAAYSIDIECARPTDDPRCTKNDYAIDLAESLAVLRGPR